MHPLISPSLRVSARHPHPRRWDQSLGEMKQFTYSNSIKQRIFTARECPLSLSLPLSLSHTHTHTHTQTNKEVVRWQIGIKIKLNLDFQTMKMKPGVPLTTSTPLHYNWLWSSGRSYLR